MAENLTRRRLRTPRAAAVAGIIFSVLLTVSILLIGLSNQNGVGTPTSSSILIVALNLVPVAGIAFLWFIGVLRDRIGQYEDRFFATVFLGSGLLFLAMLFLAAAVVSGALISPNMSQDVMLSREITHAIMNGYAMRMAAVFMISTSTILLRTAVLSRWLAYIGYIFALVQLFAFAFWEWILLLFPLWILALSIEILIVNAEKGSGTMLQRKR